LATVLTDEDKGQEAKEVYERGLRSLPQSENILSGYASLLYDLGEKEAALAAYEKLTNRHADNAYYLTLLGNVYLDLNLYGLALEAYEKANHLAEEKQGWIIGNIGNILNSRGFYPKAITSLKQALRLEPDSDYAAERLAQALKQDREEREKARKIVREHIRLTQQSRADEAESSTQLPDTAQQSIEAD